MRASIVGPAAAVRSGTLKKRSRKGKWQARWFTLSSTGTLSYYISEKAAREHSAVGGAFDCSQLGAPTADADGVTFFLDAGTDGGSGDGDGTVARAGFRAADAEEATAWMDAIMKSQTVCAGGNNGDNTRAVSPSPAVALDTAAPKGSSVVPEELDADADADNTVDKGDEGGGETSDALKLADAAAGTAASGCDDDGGVGVFGAVEQELSTEEEASATRPTSASAVQFAEPEATVVISQPNDGATPATGVPLLGLSIAIAVVGVAVFMLRKRQN